MEMISMTSDTVFLIFFGYLLVSGIITYWIAIWRYRKLPIPFWMKLRYLIHACSFAALVFFFILTTWFPSLSWLGDLFMKVFLGGFALSLGILLVMVVMRAFRRKDESDNTN